MKIKKLLDLCDRINSEKNLSELLLLIAKETADLLEADKASVFLLDREENELWSIATLDNKEIRFDARLGIAGKVISTGKSLRIDDVYEDTRFYKGVDTKTNYKTKNILVVPLINQNNETMGTFQALNKKSKNFSIADEKLMNLAAKHIATAIETAKLFDHYIVENKNLIDENTKLNSKLKKQFSTKNILGNSPEIQNIVRLIEQLSDVSVDVLITGESGTGKELIAKAVHYSSSIFSKPFISLNCAAIPENLLESELFGIEKGIATGVEKRVGKFEQAHGGTLFLDEIGDMSKSAQAKILRVLQERVVERIGGVNQIPVDVRIIAATNKNLEDEIKALNFRNDLYFRLKVIHIKTPPLRTIPDDIPLLAQNFINIYCNQMKKKTKKLSKNAIDILKHYYWPGNTRELENEMKKLVILCPRTTIQSEDFPDYIRLQKIKLNNINKLTLKQAVEDLETRMIRDALEINNKNKMQTANYLGLSRWGLTKKMKRYNITD